MYAAYTHPRHVSSLTRDEDKTKTIPGKLLSISSTFRLLIAAALAMAAILALIPPAGHDQLWFLLLSQRWLHGATPYGPQVFDSNTPAILWLGALPVFLAEHLHLPLPAVAKTLFLALAALIAAFSHRILRRLTPLTEPQTLFLTLIFITVFLVVPARDLGQRDPLATLLCLPYLLLAAAAPQSRVPHRTLAILLAAIAFCLKPQLTLIAIAIEIYLVFTRSVENSTKCRSTARPALGRFRPEPAILLLSGTLFYAAIRLYAPLYLTLALPTVLSTYWAIGHLTPLQLLTQSPELHLLAALTLIAYTLRPRTRLTTILLAAALAATASYYLQSTGWYYQQLPAITLFALTLAFTITPLIPKRLLVPIPYSLFPTLLTLLLTWHFSGYSFTHLPTPDETYAISTPDPTFFSTLPPGTPIATLTTSVDDAIMPIVRYHLTWAQRTNNLWTLPALLRTQSPAGFPIPASHRLPPDRLAFLAALERRWMVEDLTRWHPALVLVARCQDPATPCQELEDRPGNPSDNLLNFFLQDPTFAALWHQNYRYQRTSGPYDAYEVRRQE